MLTILDKIKELRAYFGANELADKLNLSTSTINNITKKTSKVTEKKINEMFEQHCLTNSTKIPVSQLTNQTKQNQMMLISTPDGFQPILQIFNKKSRPIHKLTVDEYSLRCSNDHLVETIDGWIYAADLGVGCAILTKKGYKPLISNTLDGDEPVYDFEVGHHKHRYWSSGISSHNSGKSFLLCNMLRQAQKEIDAFVFVIDSENALDDDFVGKIGVDTSEENYMYAGVITVGHVKKVVSNFINAYKETGETRKVVIAIDSLGMLLTDNEFKQLEDGEAKGDQGQRAKQLKALLKGFVQSIKKLNIQMIITDQVYAATQDNILAGTNDGLWVVNGAVKYSLSNLLLLTKLRLKEGTNVTGINMKVEAIKTRFTKPFQKVAVEVPYETGMDSTSGLVDVLVELGVVRKNGAWYVIESINKQIRSANIGEYLDVVLKDAAEKTDVAIGSFINEEDEIVEKGPSAAKKRIENYLAFTDKNPDYVPEVDTKDSEGEE